MNAGNVNGNLVILVGFVDLISRRRVVDHKILTTVHVSKDGHPFIKLPVEWRVMKEFVGETREEGVMRALIMIDLVVVMAVSRMLMPVFNAAVTGEVTILAIVRVDDWHVYNRIDRVMKPVALKRNVLIWFLLMLLLWLQFV